MSMYLNIKFVLRTFDPMILKMYILFIKSTREREKKNGIKSKRENMNKNVVIIE